jgi:hypothetical protein
MKRRFIRIDLDFKNAFNSMSQAFLWVILENHDIPDIDLLKKSFYEYSTVGLPHSDIGNVKITFQVVTQGWSREASSLHYFSLSSSTSYHVTSRI